MIPPDLADAISRAMRGDFGPPGKSLQQDIADELADHLAQSMDRERRSGKSEDEARERVLNRFGSPSQIAARLWFDGMKGQIMFQRWMIGTTTAALVVAFLAVGLAFWSIQESNRTLLAAVEAMDKKIVRPAPSMDWVKLRFKCIDDATGEPIRDVFLSLIGNLISTPKDQLTIKTDKDGLAMLGPLRPGRHDFTVAPNENWISNGSLMVMPGESEEIVIRCPERNPKKAVARIRLPEVVEGQSKAIVVVMRPISVIQDRTFTSPRKLTRLITASGLDFTWNPESKNTSELLKTAEPDIELTAGTYRLGIQFYERKKGWAAGQETPSTGRGSSDPGVGDIEWDIEYRSPKGNFELVRDMVALPDKLNEWVVPTRDELPEEWLQKPEKIQTPIPRLPKTRSKPPQQMLQPPAPPDDDLSLPDLKLPGTP